MSKRSRSQKLKSPARGVEDWEAERKQWIEELLHFENLPEGAAGWLAQSQAEIKQAAFGVGLTCKVYDEEPAAQLLIAWVESGENLVINRTIKKFWELIAKGVSVPEQLFPQLNWKVLLSAAIDDQDLAQLILSYPPPIGEEFSLYFSLPRHHKFLKHFARFKRFRIHTGPPGELRDSPVLTVSDRSERPNPALLYALAISQSKVMEGQMKGLPMPHLEKAREETRQAFFRQAGRQWIRTKREFTVSYDEIDREFEAFRASRARGNNTID